MHSKRTKNQPANQRQASPESFYNEAFKLFAGGFSNQKIEKYNHSELTITQLLEPSIEMVLDQIQGKVTKNVKFQKTTSYFVKRKQFISDIINRRNSKGFNRDEMEFFNEFLKICEYYHQNRSLNEYVYLKLELIFDRIYYSHKKKESTKAGMLEIKDQEEQQKEEEDGEEIYQVRPKKRERKANEQAIVVSKPKEEKKHLAANKTKQEKKTLVAPINNEQPLTPLSQGKHFSSELQRKKKDLEVLELQHEILLKRSKMLQVQAQINQIEGEMNKILQTAITSPPSSNKNTSFSASKKKETTKLVIRQPMQEEPSETIISSDSIKLAKEQEQQEEEEEQKEVDDYEESQYQFKRLSRKKSKHNSKPKKKKSKQERRIGIMDYQTKKQAPIIVKSSLKIPQKKQIQQTQIQSLIQSKNPKTKSLSKRLQKPIVSRQDYYSRYWKPQQQKFLVSQFQSVNIIGLPTVQSQLTKQFGKKDRFRITSIKEKKSTMFKECRKKYLKELQKRQLVSDEQFKNVVEHLHCLDNRASFDFISKFLHSYYFSDIDTMLNKAVKDTYTAILKLKKRPRHYSKDSCDWQNNAENVGESQSYFPFHQESPHADPVNRTPFKRQILRLGITENDIVETRKAMNYNKQTKELAIKKEQSIPTKQGDTYFGQDMQEEQVKVKEDVGTEEGKGTKTGANMKSVFQKYMEEVKDK